MPNIGNLYGYSDTNAVIPVVYTTSTTLVSEMNLYDNTGTYINEKVGTILSSDSFELMPKYTLTINTTPSNATVYLTINGQTTQARTATIFPGTSVHWTAHASNYDDLNGDITPTQDTTLTENLYSTNIPWSTSAQRNSQAWHDITYNGSIYAVVSESSQIGITDDLSANTWNVVSAGLGGPKNYYWYGIAYGNNKFVVLDRKGWLSYSTDNCITWATKFRDSNLATVADSTTFNGHWYDILWDGTRFVALSYHGYLSTSSDGITWNTAITPADLTSTSGYWVRLKWDGVRYIALAYDGFIGYSTNLTNWTVYKPSVFGTNSRWNALIVNSQTDYHKYVVFQSGTTGTVYTTTCTDITDPTSWTALQSYTGSSNSDTGLCHEWRDGIYTHNNKYAIVGDSGWVAVANAS